MSKASSATAQKASPSGKTRVETSRGFGHWLREKQCSLAFTSYQSGKLFLVGMLPNGKVSLHQQTFERAMGVHVGPDRLHLASAYQVWRLENVLAPTERANEHFDALYAPRNAQITGDIDIHELSVDRYGRVVFINTRFSCLATFDPRFGFQPIWKPDFVSALAAEDRCHLNGLAMEDGLPRYVTAVSRSDVVTGWRARRAEGGVLIDVRNDRILTEKLSMPHSPRLHAGKLWALDSGRGYLVQIDRDTGEASDVAFCPGFLRGLSFIGDHALVTVSLPRNGAFEGLELDETLKARDGEAWCGVLVIDTKSGSIIEYLRLRGGIEELFDVAVIDHHTCPMAIGLNSPELRSTLTYHREFAPLDPGAA